jgi:phospholipid/cholesterol/gamma-HCH transport system substrate-binding protein
MQISREIRVGVVVTLGIVLLYFGFNFLKGKNLFSPSRSYYAVFDNVDQLMPSARVQVNGFQVGIVDQVGFLSEGSYKVLVKFLIDNDDLNIPKDSEAHIVQDLLGTRTLELTLGKSTQMAERGDTLTAVRDAGITDEIKKAILPLKAQIEALAGSVDSVLTGFNNVFNRKTQDGLISSFESVNTSIKRFEHTVNEFDLLVTNERHKLSSILSNVASITDNLKNNNEKLSHVFTNMDRISDDVAKSNVKQTLTDLQETIASLNKVLKNVESGQGTLGKLATDDSLYVNLDHSSRNLSLLLEDMKAHPNRYVHFSVFGKKEKAPKK